MARVYATSVDAWPTNPPSNADSLLAAASGVVDHLLRGVVYDTDTDGYPTDTGVSDALQAATVAIALEAQSSGFGAAGSALSWDQVKIGSVSLGSRRPADGVAVINGIPVPPLALWNLSTVGELRVVVR